MAGHTVRPTAKAQRKVDAHNLTAQASQLGNVRNRRATRRSGLPINPAEVIPEQPTRAQPAPPTAGHDYLAKEHVRRDIGSQIQVLHLAARNAPANAPHVIRDHEGAPMPFLVRCETHGTHRYLRAYSSAVRAAKSSHHWCEGCKKEVTAFHKLHARVSRPTQK